MRRRAGIAKTQRCSARKIPDNPCTALDKDTNPCPAPRGEKKMGGVAIVRYLPPLLPCELAALFAGG